MWWLRVSWGAMLPVLFLRRRGQFATHESVMILTLAVILTASTHYMSMVFFRTRTRNDVDEMMTGYSVNCFPEM